MTMKKTIIILILLFGILSAAFSQEYKLTESEEPVNLLGMNVGLNDFHIKDQYLSPYIFRGNIISSTIFYQLKSGNNRHAIRLFFSFGGVNSSIQLRDVNVSYGSIQYDFSHVIDSWKVAGHMLNFYIGTGFSTSAEYTKMNAESNERNSYYYDESWYSSHSISFHLYTEYNLENRKSLSILLTSPAIRLVTRPENGHNFSERNSEISENSFNMLTGGELEFIWNDLVLFTEFEYKTPLGKTINVYGKYRFAYIASHRPETLTLGMYMNHFLVGIEWLF